jgi:deoxyribodipyrimidine photolyase-related protein
MSSSENESATLIFPHQLFKNNPALFKGRKVFLIEEQLFFGDFKYTLYFHKKKLVLHRASMKYYHDFLKKQGYDVIYVEYQKDAKMSYIFNELKKYDINCIYCAELIDHMLKIRLINGCSDHQIKLVELEGPGFLTSLKWIEDYFEKKKSYFLTSFYIAQRKRLNILLSDEKPKGGKWSYDTQNRKKIPKKMQIPTLLKLNTNNYIEEARDYVDKSFSENPGEVKDFFYPVTHYDAKKWLSDFISKRLMYFGDYEDSIQIDEPFLFHSILSSSLNIGLITPQQVIEDILNADAPLNSKEGFIRQIIGWREFMRAIYIREGTTQRTSNFFQNHKKINQKIYWGKTGVLPYDKVVSRVIKYSFAHHIERLMVLGNFMLLVDLDPQDIYRWFMEMFIDAYDWVMVPNVYGMSQYADGGIITSKPYFSSSNYLLKMSDFPRGEWCDVWNALFWRFMQKNWSKIGKNPRLALLKRHIKNKDKMNHQIQISEDFLKELFS